MSPPGSEPLRAPCPTIDADLQAAVEHHRMRLASAPKDADCLRRLRDAVLAARSAAPEDTAPVGSSPSRLADARALLSAGKLEAAEMRVRERLVETPGDVEAMNLLADIAARCGFLDNGVAILRRAARYAPEDAASWSNLGRLLHRQGRIAEALFALEESLRHSPDDEAALSFAASVLVQQRRLDEGMVLFERLVAAHPCRARGWMNYGYLLKTMGRTGEAIAAYRLAAALDPTSGAVWWGLANLKAATFLAEDLDAMAAALETDLPDTERWDLHFAYAAALDQFGRYDEAAAQLALGNGLRRRAHPHQPALVTRDVDLSIELFTRDFLAARSGWGSPRRDPIFILGMPRSGSTLVEQILASHSAIEGTEELPVIQRISASLAGLDGGRQAIADLSGEALESLGERYLAETARYRRTDRPFFTDKMPGNWPYVGLIHLMLPNARIIDVRRDPRDCCFANYAQHFQSGMNAMYGQEDLAAYYRDYVRLMRHFDAVLPGRIYRLVYEDLLDDLEGSLRGLMHHLELPFEPNCLRFFETERAVHTPSAQQVRRPINRDSVGRWRAYRAHLKPLLDGLGELTGSYRD